MPAISRLYNFQEGEPAIADQVDDELNAIIAAVNLLPDKNGILQTDLNADMLDGKHASTTGGADKIPVCNTATIQSQLNADMVDGLHASDISAAAFTPGTRLIYQQPTPPSGWTEIPKPTDYVLGWKSGQDGGTLVVNSWTISGITTVVDNHTLTLSQIPAHGHTINHTVVIPVKDPAGLSNPLLFTIERSELTEADGEVNVTITANSGSSGGGTGHNHTASNAHSGVWRPPTAYIIVAEKD